MDEHRLPDTLGARTEGSSAGQGALTYMLMIRVSVRLPRDHAALARTLGDLSQREFRMAFAVSATNITSCKSENLMQSEEVLRTQVISSVNICILASCSKRTHVPHLMVH